MLKLGRYWTWKTLSSHLNACKILVTICLVPCCHFETFSKAFFRLVTPRISLTDCSINVIYDKRVEKEHIMLCLAWTKRSQIYINTWFRVTWLVCCCIPEPLLNSQFHCFPLTPFNQLKSLSFSISYHFSCKHLSSWSALIPLRTSELELLADWSGRHTILILLAGKTFCAISSEDVFTENCLPLRQLFFFTQASQKSAECRRNLSTPVSKTSLSHNLLPTLYNSQGQNSFLYAYASLIVF